MSARLHGVSCVGRELSLKSLKLKNFSVSAIIVVLLLPATVTSQDLPPGCTPMWKEARSLAAKGTQISVPQSILNELAANPDDCSDPAPGQTTKMDAYRVHNGAKALIAVRGNSSCFCSATGNCEFWVYRSHGAKHEIVLHDEMVNYFTFLKHQTSGYRDLVLWSHGSAFQSSARLLRFNGKEYEQACEWEEEYSGHELPAGGWVWDPTPRITSNTCAPTTKSN